MKKRGQVTAFMIVGLVILIVIILLFSVKRLGIGIKTQDYLQMNLDDVKNKVDNCIDKDAKDILDTLGKQGGYLNPSSYKMYNGYKVAYLCFNIPNTDQCANAMVNAADIEKQLSDYLKSNLPYCADIQNLGKGFLARYDVQVSAPDIKTSIEENSVVFDVDYPITLKKGDASATLPSYKKSVSVPLGLLLDTTYFIVNEEASRGVFFSAEYMIAKRGAVEIYKDQPYPDKIYVLNARDSEYKFQFAVQSEGKNE